MPPTESGGGITQVTVTLENVGAPTKAKQIGLTEDHVVKALTTAQSLRPDRYTILSKNKLDKKAAYRLAKSVRVI